MSTPTPAETNRAAVLPEEQEAWAAVAALRRELAAAEERIKAIDRERQELDQRIRQLRDGWRMDGEITLAEKKARHAGKPRIRTGCTDRVIVRVEARWIVLDGWHKEQFYDRNTGREKGHRSEFATIDAPAALAAWADYERRVKEHAQKNTSNTPKP